MNKNFVTVFLLVLIAAISGCSQPGNFSSDSSSSSTLTGVQTNALTNDKVQTAVDSMLSEWRLGGSVRVRGIQEIPNQNAAVADLQFEQFEYGTTTEGGLVKAKDFAPKPMPQGRERLPTMEEMFPQRKTVYSKDGKAVLSRYNDGRWILKEVRWGFDTGVKGTVDIR